jgi:hypothetical protein
MMSRRKRTIFTSGVLILFFSVFAFRAFAAGVNDDPLFQTGDLERELSMRFGLKAREINALRPLIRMDNRNSVLLYVKAADDHEADYMFLWEKVRRGHTEFEAAISSKLSRKDRDVLKAAHVEFESRILSLWLDDYTSLLTQVLELDTVQQGMVAAVLDVERLRRHALILRTGEYAGKNSAEWDELTRQRDGELIRLLRKEQIRAYRSLVDPPAQLIAAHRSETPQTRGE